MYDSIFLSSQGSNIYTTLGSLEGLKDEIKLVKFWNCSGNGSLIIFFKCLGYTFKQMFKALFELPLLNNIINGASLIPGNAEEYQQFIKNWLVEKMKENQFLNPQVTLAEVYNLTKIFPCFIIWDRNSKKIININPTNNPTVTLLDAVMSCLCCLGIFVTYKFDNYLASNIFNIDSYPYIYSYLAEKNNYLYIGNICFLNKNKYSILGPLNDTEEEIITQFCENTQHRIINISKTFENNFLKLYSDLQRGNSSKEELTGLFRLGLNQSNAFLQNEDTEIEYRKIKAEIYSQS